jgi:hypothetical protein
VSMEGVLVTRQREETTCGESDIASDTIPSKVGRAICSSVRVFPLSLLMKNLALLLRTFILHARAQIRLLNSRRRKLRRRVHFLMRLVLSTKSPLRGNGGMLKKRNAPSLPFRVFVFLLSRRVLPLPFHHLHMNRRFRPNLSVSVCVATSECELVCPNWTISLTWSRKCCIPVRDHNCYGR